MKKIFLVAKVHEMEPATIMSGERRVVFSACNPSDNEFEFTFNRTSLQNLVEVGKINSADADTITGTGLNGFIMPEPYPKAPFGSYFNTFIGINDFVESYKKSARKLGASRMKDIKLEITPEYVKLRLVY